MIKLGLIVLVLVLVSSFGFASVNNVCENIHVSVDNQDKYFGGNFGETVCISSVPLNTYFVNYNKISNWEWRVHKCTEPEQEQNLLRFFYCGGIN